ncbi:RNA-binding protein 38 [Capsella rubella]|uniref:RNA-binding protein 38 n=1 Tax=Capsella rubella TaxID=81985 RepID=UPI000CD51495|nr:RNA-binding protein 38 [Capsella rubella]
MDPDPKNNNMSQPNNQANNDHDTRFTKIFIGNLTWRTTSDDLITHFGRFGEVVHANVVCETYPGRSKGYGFVTFRDSDSAARALENKNPVIDGRTTNCQLATLGARKKINPPNQNGSLLNQVRPPQQYQPRPVHVPPLQWDPFAGQYIYMYNHNVFHNPYPTHMTHWPYGLPSIPQHNLQQTNMRHAVAYAPQESSVQLNEIINDTDQESAPQRSSVRTENINETTDQELTADVAHHDNEEAATKPAGDVDQPTATDQEGGKNASDEERKINDQEDITKQDDMSMKRSTNDIKNEKICKQG